MPSKSSKKIVEEKRSRRRNRRLKRKDRKDGRSSKKIASPKGLPRADELKNPHLKPFLPRRRSSKPNSEIDSPTKHSPKRFKLKQSSQLSHVRSVNVTDSRKRSPIKINFANESDQISTDFIIRDFCKSAVIRNASLGSATNEEDEDDTDLEALAMLGKYGNMSRLIHNRAVKGRGRTTGGDKIRNVGFRTPTKKSNMFEKTQEILSSMSSPSSAKGPSLGSFSGEAALTSPKSSPSDKMMRRMANTSSGNVTPVRRALINSSIAKATSLNASPSDKKTHRNHLETIDRTPTKLRGFAKDGGKDTPLKQLHLNATEDDPPTPYRLRRRVAHTLQKLKDQEETDSSESSSDEEQMNEGKMGEDNNQSPAHSKLAEKNGVPNEKVLINLSSKGKREAKLANKENTDNYFETYGHDERGGKNRIQTSDHTLSRNLKAAQLCPEALRSILDGEELRHKNEIHKLLHSHAAMFNKWLLWLSQDFNLLLYGLGSKRDLLSDLHTHISKVDPEAHVLIVNGYFPSLTLKHIFNGIINDLLDGAISKDGSHTGNADNTGFTASSDQCEIISKALKANNEYLYLIIHNLDGLALRSDKIQGSFAKLASSNRIRLVASIDHVNAPLLWDADKRSKFNFVWYDATTFLPYTEETLNENSLVMTSTGGSGGDGGRLGTGALALNSLSRVFESLTPNAKEVYLTIVRYQLEALEELKEDKKNGDDFKSSKPQIINNMTYQGLSFKDLYRRCRKAFLVNSDLTLRAQLTEFRDHKLIRERKGVDDGIDYLIIPLNAVTLGEFLEQRNNMDGK